MTGVYDMPFSFYMDRDYYEERYGEEVGTCNRHKVQVVDRSCDLCADELEQAEDSARCRECDEVRLDEYGDIDARVEAGMKCGVCTYG
tara:strand:+ start:1126 stop:1389 length:264 start_codon:yes stop_codon:yes gene_type:complete